MLCSGRAARRFCDRGGSAAAATAVVFEGVAEEVETTARFSIRVLRWAAVLFALGVWIRAWVLTPNAKQSIKRWFLQRGFNLEGNGNQGSQYSAAANAAKKQRLATVRFRFHNVQGLSNATFRKHYLCHARRTCDILMLAETNCTSKVDEKLWSADWIRSAHISWASQYREETRGRKACNCRYLPMFCNWCYKHNLYLVDRDS